MNFNEIIIINAGINRIYLKDIMIYLEGFNTIQEGDILYYSTYNGLSLCYDFKVKHINNLHNYIVLEVIN